MKNKVDCAVIMAAGTSSRFAPLSYEKPKALIEVRGEVLIERQIRQLKEAGVPEIVVVTGYKSEQFSYLREKLGVTLVHNAEYLVRNNNSSIRAAETYLRNAYVCSADNYFTENPFESEVDGAYYAAEYAEGQTAEWCMTEDADGFVDSVTVGGRDAWYMLGHTFWDEEFSRRFKAILGEIYDRPETAGLLWESIYAAHLDELKMKIRKYAPGVIFEFDTLDELRQFDPSYADDARSPILRACAEELGVRERDLVDLKSVKGADFAAAGFTFTAKGKRYAYDYADKSIKEC
ncbi:MAG: NTP transferase domain-containing protein [Clostridia bacterium]|nr:NTP transferase domain-containing protein [Clostridia bacterium]